MEPDDGEYDPGQRGNALEQREDRRQEIVDGAGTDHQQRQCPADDECAGEPGQDAQDRRQHIPKHGSVGKDFDAAPEYIDQRRKQEAWKEQRCELPEQDDHTNGSADEPTRFAARAM